MTTIFDSKSKVRGTNHDQFYNLKSMVMFMFDS